MKHAETLFALPAEARTLLGNVETMVFLVFHHLVVTSICAVLQGGE